MALPRFSFSGGATDFFQPNQALFRTTFTPSDKLQSDTYQAEAKAYKDAVEKHNEALKVNPNVDPPKPTPLSFTQEEFDQFGVDASRRAQQLQNARQNAFNAISNPSGFSQQYGIGSLGFGDGGEVSVNFVGTGEFPETESSVGYRTGPASQDKELPLAAELLVDFTPVVGDVKAGIEAADYFNKGEYGNAALAGVGVLPFVPPLVSMTKKFKGKPKATAERLLTGEDGKPQRFYHGTREEFKEFDSDAPYTFVSDEPSTAEYYAGEIGRHDDKAPNIRPVYLKDANFFDVDNSDHLKQLRESNWYKSQKQELDVGWTRGPGEGDFVDQVEAGDYNTIEDSGLIDWIKSQDFDGFTTYEQDGKNFAVFNVEDIVNGVVKKKEGGAVGAGIASLRPSETRMGFGGGGEVGEGMGSLSLDNRYREAKVFDLDYVEDAERYNSREELEQLNPSFMVGRYKISPNISGSYNRSSMDIPVNVDDTDVFIKQKYKQGDGNLGFNVTTPNRHGFGANVSGNYFTGSTENPEELQAFGDPAKENYGEGFLPQQYNAYYRTPEGLTISGNYREENPDQEREYGIMLSKQIEFQNVKDLTDRIARLLEKNRP
jgi:hypothetical protein